MILSPSQYPDTPVSELFAAAAKGHARIDHRWLRAILDRGDEAIAAMSAFIERDDEQAPRVPLGDVLLDLIRAMRSPTTLPLLAEFARANAFDFSDELIDAYRALGAAAVDPLLELYREAGGEPFDISFTLASLGVRDERILGILLEELKSNAVEAALSLGLYADPVALPAIHDAIAANAVDETIRRELEAALRAYGVPRDGEAGPYDIWADYPEQAMPHFAVLDPGELREFLASPVAGYRARAASSLGFEEMTESDRDRLFALAQNDPDPSVRGACWEALESEVDDAPAIADAMRSRLNDSSVPFEERGGALVALAHTVDDHPEIRRAITEFLELPGGPARALEAMWHSADRRFAGLVPRYLDDAGLEVRRQAIAAVGWLGIVSQLGRLEKLMADEEVRDAALFAYALAAPGDTSAARLRKLFRRIEDIAHGLSDEDDLIVRKGLDDRLQMHGLEPMFVREAIEAWTEDEEAEDEEFAPVERPGGKVGRNDPCPCGSGKKFKKCCGA